MIKQIFLDMDGVLTDFTGDVMRLFGREYNPEEHIGSWDIDDVLDISADELWRKIDEQGSKFWSEMTPLPRAFALYELVRSYADVIITTTPSEHSSSAAGKLEWLDRHFRPSGRRAFRKYMLCVEKHHLAGPGCVLIDDKNENCERFVAAGGQAILFPQPWNDNHPHIDRPLHYTWEQLELLK